MMKANALEHDDTYREIGKHLSKQLQRITRKPAKKRRKLRPHHLGTLKHDRLFNVLDQANPDHQELLILVKAQGFKNTAEAALSDPSSPQAKALGQDIRKQSLKAARFTANLRRDVINATDPVQKRIGGTLNSLPDWVRQLVRDESSPSHAMPNAIQAQTSPGGYLVHLYNIANAKGTGFDYGVGRETGHILHIDTRRPDIKQIALSEANAKQEIPTINIVNHVLQTSIETQKGNALADEDLEQAFFPPALPYVADVENTQIAMKSLGVESLNALELRTRPLARPVDFSASNPYFFINNVAEPLQLGTMNTSNIGDEVGLLTDNLSVDVNTWTDLLGYTDAAGPTDGIVTIDDFIYRMNISKDELNILYRQYEAFDDFEGEPRFYSFIDYPVDAQNDITEETLGDQLDGADLVNIKLWNGHWVQNITVPDASSYDSKTLYIHSNADLLTHLFINGQEIVFKRGYEEVYQAKSGVWVSSVTAGEFGAQLFTHVGQYLSLDEGHLKVESLDGSDPSVLSASQQRALNFLLRLNQGTKLSPVDIDWVLACEGATTITHCDSDSTTEAVKNITADGLTLLAHYIHYQEHWALDVNTFVGLVYTLNPYGYFVPLPAQPESTEEPETIVYSQLRTLFGEDGAPIVREACLDPACTVASVNGDEALKGLFCAGLRLSKAEWDAITPLLENYNDGNLAIDEKVLSQIGRLPMICQLMGGLSVLHTLALCEHLGLTTEVLSPMPITALSGINKLIWLSQWMSDHGYTPESLCETLSDPSEHTVDTRNEPENEVWLQTLKGTMQGSKASEATFASYESIYLENNPAGEGLLSEFMTGNIVDSYGLVIADSKDDIATFVEGTLTEDWTWPENDPSGEQYKSNLSNVVWNCKLQQDQITLNKVAELNVNANQSVIEPMLLWMGYSNIYTLSNMLLAWDYVEDDGDDEPTSEARTSLLWDLRNRLNTIQKHEFLGEDLNLIANPTIRGWLSTASELSFTDQLDWPALYTLSLFKGLQVGSATAEAWLGYLMLVNQEEGATNDPENLNAYLLAGLLGCHPDEILEYKALDGQLPTTVEAIDQMARRVDVGIELDLNVKEMIPLLHCASDNSDAQNASASAQLALARHASNDPALLYTQASSERKRDALVALYMKNLVWAAGSELAPYVFDNESLYRYLLLDVNVSSQVPTSVIVEAHATLQLYIYRALSSLEGSPDFVNRTDLETSWPYDKEYRIWQANEELALYPSNYIEPEMRSSTSQAYQQFMSAISSSSFEDDDIDQQVYAYLESLMAEVEVKPISFCKELYDGSSLITYHFVGKSIRNPAFFYRKVDIDTSTLTEREDWLASLTWSYWQSLSIPSIDEIASNVVIGISEHQLYLLWIELKQATTSSSEEYEFIPFYAKASSSLELNAANHFRSVHEPDIFKYDFKPQTMAFLSQAMTEPDQTLLVSFSLPAKNESDDSLDLNTVYDMRITKASDEIVEATDPDGTLDIRHEGYDVESPAFQAWAQRFTVSHSLNSANPQTRSLNFDTHLYLDGEPSGIPNSSRVRCPVDFNIQLLPQDQDEEKWKARVTSNTGGSEISTHYDINADVNYTHTPYKGADTGNGYLKTSFEIWVAGDLQETVDIAEHLPAYNRNNKPLTNPYNKTLLNVSTSKTSSEFSLAPDIYSTVTVKVKAELQLENAETEISFGTSDSEIIYYLTHTSVDAKSSSISFSFSYSIDGNISDLLFQYTHLAPTNCESFLCLPPIIGCTSQYLVAVSSS
ncbi:neuraminidase-like domain-containing protein, partial [Zooshikella sp. RANM57]|uniref:neuraminidase-like domain-containing protein n=1 Tax=Zooshikella sp. RANM57 TaxID=3425863 RepID=UPI003D6EE7C4